MNAPAETPPRPVVLVTGGGGLIGRRLIDRLKQRCQVIGMDVEAPAAEDVDVRWIEADFTSDASVDEALDRVRNDVGRRIDSVIHLAAYYDFSGEDSPLYEELTVKGTRRLLQGLRDFAVGQFVFSSTLLVMQPGEEGEQLSEASRTRPNWAYPESKIAAERVIREERGEIPVVILRIAGVYDEMCHSLPISQQISRIYERQLESFVFPGDASRGQALVHLDDLTVCIERVVALRGRLDAQELFLIAEPDVMSYDELQDRIGELVHGKEWPTIRIPKVVAKTGAWLQEKLADSEEEKPFIRAWMVDLADEHYAVNIRHARTRLGWDPQHRLRDTLPEIVANLHANPRGWYEENKLHWPEDRDDLPVEPPRTRQRPAGTRPSR